MNPAKNTFMINAICLLLGLNKSSGFAYSPIPAPPMFGTTTTLSPANGPTVEAGETGGNHDLLIPLSYNNNLQPNGLIGTLASPYRFKSADDTVRSWVGGSNITTGEQVIDNLNNANFCYFYHLGIIGNPSPATQGISGVTWRPFDPAVRKSTLILNDIIIKDMAASIVQINSAVEGSTYDYIEMKYVRGFGYSAAQNPGANGSQEGMYQGSTATDHNAESRFTNSVYENILIVDKGREGMQFNNHMNLSARRGTCVNVGQTDTAGQNNLVQVQNCNGIIEDWIFYNAPNLFNIAAQGFTFRNCSFYFDGGQGTILRMGDYSHYDSSPAKTGQELLFENCYFHSFSPITDMIDVREDQCDITFTNCSKNSNITNMYADNRTDKLTFTLSNSGTTAENNPIPVFKSLDPLDENNQGLVKTAYHVLRHQGYRTL